MKRCSLPLVFALALAGAAQAQTEAHSTQRNQLTATESTTILPAAPGSRPGVRNFPKEALRGQMTVKQFPYVDMDERLTQFTPGARILDTGNRNLRPATLTGRAQTVNYLMDTQGRITQAWILSADEVAERRRTLGVERNYSFESQQDARGLPARSAPASR